MKTGRKKPSGLLVNITLGLICLIWLIPTIGLLISSFRTRDDVLSTGWWMIFPHREWFTIQTTIPSKDIDRNQPMTFSGVTATFEEFRQGIKTPDGHRVIWIGNKRAGTVQIQEQKWTTTFHLTLQNYKDVLTGKVYQWVDIEGNKHNEQGDDLAGALFNSLAVTLPSVVFPVTIATFAAYGFAWMRFPGRKQVFTGIVALLVVPLQIALIPVLRDYVKLELNGTFLALWLAHTGFGVPLAIYLLNNYISTLPKDILESAFVDGASHFTIFTKLVVPLSIPAIASYAIFQFLWVWNDYLVALIFIGNKPKVQILTMRLAEIVGSRGSDWHLLTAGAFISMILPLTVFFALQRYFVRGLLAGSVKG